jgi:uncharacterized protein (TIGR03643 family)
MKAKLTEAELSHIIAWAWADDISFDRIKREIGLSEGEVIAIMRGNLKRGSFKVWRERVSGRKAKHERKSVVENQNSGQFNLRLATEPNASGHE